MSSRPIMDAGPGLNFLSLNKERLLFSALGPLSVPEIVEREILRKAQHDVRFAPAAKVWKKLPPKLMNVLSDDVTDELATVVQRVTGLPPQQRFRSDKDLGELMVIAHAAVAAQQGQDTTILIDDSDGRSFAVQEQRRLQRIRESGVNVGSISLISTITVLTKTAGRPDLPDRKSMRALYGRLRSLDDGLIPLSSTNLMDLPCWR